MTLEILSVKIETFNPVMLKSTWYRDIINQVFIKQSFFIRLYGVLNDDIEGIEGMNFFHQ